MQKQDKEKMAVELIRLFANGPYAPMFWAMFILTIIINYSIMIGIYYIICWSLNGPAYTNIIWAAAVAVAYAYNITKIFNKVKGGSNDWILSSSHRYF